MLSRGETQEQTAQALKQVGHASFSRASSIFPNEESTHLKNAFEGKDIGLCYAYTGWILAFLYLEEVIVYSHREYKMCRRALSARSSQ